MAVGCYFKLTTKQLKIGIEDYVSVNNRSQIVKQNSNQILLDAYNANPSSMGVALENFKRIQNSNKIAILGDMFELGATSAKEHLEIINQAILTKGCIFYFVGSHFFEQKTSHSNFLFFETFGAAGEQIRMSPHASRSLEKHKKNYGKLCFLHNTYDFV